MFWDKLDGRAKYLIHLYNLNYIDCATAAYSLCGLVEYELQKLLKSVADERVRLDNSLYVKMNETDYILYLIPEPTIDDYSLNEQINILKTISNEIQDIKPSIIDTNGFVDVLHQIKNIRNRVMHSFFIEKHHLMELEIQLF